MHVSLRLGGRKCETSLYRRSNVRPAGTGEEMARKQFKMEGIEVNVEELVNHVITAERENENG